MRLAGATTFSIDDYDFIEWAANANGSGALYATGVDHEMKTENITLYANWLPIYTITFHERINDEIVFNKNDLPAELKLHSGDTFIVPDLKYSSDIWRFIG